MSTLSSWFLALGVLLSLLAAPLGWGSCCCDVTLVRVSQAEERQSSTASTCCAHGDIAPEQAPERERDNEGRPAKRGCQCTLACCTAKVLIAATSPAGGWEEAAVWSVEEPGDAGLISDDHLDRLKRPPKAIVRL